METTLLALVDRLSHILPSEQAVMAEVERLIRTHEVRLVGQFTDSHIVH